MVLLGLGITSVLIQSLASHCITLCAVLMPSDLHGPSSLPSHSPRAVFSLQDCQKRTGKLVDTQLRVLSHVQLFATLWTLAHQSPLSVEFSRQEYRSQLPFPTPEDLPDPKIKLMSPTCLWHCRQILYH